MFYARRCDLASGAVELLGQSPYGALTAAFSSDHSRVVLADQYLAGDVILYEPRRRGAAHDPVRHAARRARAGSRVPRGGNHLGAHHAERPRDAARDGALRRRRLPGVPRPLAPGRGRARRARGSRAHRRRRARDAEAPRRRPLRGDLQHRRRSWAYDARFDEAARSSPSSACSPGRATSPAACCTGSTSTGRAAASPSRSAPRRCRRSSTCSTTTPAPRTRERALGLAPELLAAGEDASFTSHDGLRVSARLYLPARAPGLRRAAPAGLLHPRRPAGPGAARLRLVLDAADPVPDPQRLRGLRAQRARQRPATACATRSTSTTTGAARTGSTTSTP